MSRQDPAYQHPGVALPQSAYVEAFQTCSGGEDGCTDDSPSCCADGNCPAGSNVVGGGFVALGGLAGEGGGVGAGCSLFWGVGRVGFAGVDEDELGRSV